MKERKEGKILRPERGSCGLSFELFHESERSYCVSVKEDGRKRNKEMKNMIHAYEKN
jgi:hypothetical protein